jgi:DNA (cytosine-5)-methyltransferase 1
MAMLTLGSLFDGIGGWPLAAVHAEAVPIWSSEIEAFPQSVTARHFPCMKQLGDITKIDGAKIDPVDIVTMGSPCQDLSIAGKREGLDGERSGLFRTAIDIIRAMRRVTGGKFPQIVVWENVPGAFSSHHGADFRAVLEEITESKIPMPKSGRWTSAGMVRSSDCEIAWRTLDAQHWGVPQRRKRIFLVADFAGRRAGEILFEPESLPGNTTASDGERKSSANYSKNGIGKTIAWTYRGRKNGCCVETQSEIACAIRTPSGGGSIPWVAYGSETDAEIANTLRATHRMAFRNDQDNVICIGNGQAHQFGLGHKTGAINCMHDQQAILEKNKFVRRLTPTECERLQGLPDGWTAGGSDSARYTALGNGMAQPCADFVIRRIVEVLRHMS